MEFSGPEDWDLPHPRIKPRSPALQADSLPAEPQGKPKNTRVGGLSLPQWSFPTQESNRGLLHRRRILYQLSYQGSPIMGTLLNVLLPSLYPHSPVFIPVFLRPYHLVQTNDEDFRMGLVCVPALPLANLVHPSSPPPKNGDKDVSYPRGSS